MTKNDLPFLEFARLCGTPYPEGTLREHINAIYFWVLLKHNGNISSAAKELEISRATIRKWAKVNTNRPIQPDKIAVESFVKKYTSKE